MQSTSVPFSNQILPNTNGCILRMLRERFITQEPNQLVLHPDSFMLGDWWEMSVDKPTNINQNTPRTEIDRFNANPKVKENLATGAAVLLEVDILQHIENSNFSLATYKGTKKEKNYKVAVEKIELVSKKIAFNGYINDEHHHLVADWKTIDESGKTELLKSLTSSMKVGISRGYWGMFVEFFGHNNPQFVIPV